MAILFKNHWERIGAAAVFSESLRLKEKTREHLRALPFEEKINLLVSMQEQAREIMNAKGKSWIRVRLRHV